MNIKENLNALPFDLLTGDREEHGAAAIRKARQLFNNGSNCEIAAGAIPQTGWLDDIAFTNALSAPMDLSGTATIKRISTLETEEEGEISPYMNDSRPFLYHLDNTISPAFWIEVNCSPDVGSVTKCSKNSLHHKRSAADKKKLVDFAQELDNIKSEAVKTHMAETGEYPVSLIHTIGKARSMILTTKHAEREWRATAES